MKRKPRFVKASGGVDLWTCVRVAEVPALKAYDKDGDGLVMWPVEEKSGEPLSQEQRDTHERMAASPFGARPLIRWFRNTKSSEYVWLADHREYPSKWRWTAYTRFKLRAGDETTLRRHSDATPSILILSGNAWLPNRMKNSKHSYNRDARYQRIERERKTHVDCGDTDGQGRVLRPFRCPSYSNAAELFMGTSVNGGKLFKGPRQHLLLESKGVRVVAQA